MTNYTFEITDGNTIYSSLSAGDTITFGTGFNYDDFSFLQDGDDLLIYADNGATLRLTDQLLGSALVYNLIFPAAVNIDLNASSLLIGTTNNATLNGTVNDDIILGGAGNNTINGGTGTDTMYGGDGNDIIIGNTNDLLYGGSGNDVLRGKDGSGVYDGGSGTDKAWWRDYQHAGSNGMSVDLDVGTATDGDGNIATITNVENVTGSVYNDALTGDDNANTIRGGADNFGLTDGDDTIYGLGGNDYLYGDKGDDTIYGDDGIDRIYGNNGEDNLFGGSGNDKLWGGSGNDELQGNDGNDYLYGNGGADILIGGKGLDFLYGGSERADKDVFAFASNEDSVDRLVNFELGSDEINITDLLFGYIDGISDIDDYVEIIHTGTRFDIKIDNDGIGGNFVNTARVLTDISDSLTAQDLLNSGDLVANNSLFI